MIKFQEVAHLYFGCPLQTKDGIGTFNVLYSAGTVKPKSCVPIGCYDLVKSDWRFSEVKPILKPLSDLTQSDADVLGWADIENLRERFFNEPELDDFTPLEFLYLLSKGFDLFNLIDNGEAIKCVER